MNMTSEETTELQPAEEQPKFSKRDMHRAMQRISKMQQDPERMRIYALHQQVRQEYEYCMQLKAYKGQPLNPMQLLHYQKGTPVDPLADLLFHGQCVLTSREARRKPDDAGDTRRSVYYHADYHDEPLAHWYKAKKSA